MHHNWHLMISETCHVLLCSTTLGRCPFILLCLPENIREASTYSIFKKAIPCPLPIMSPTLFRHLFSYFNIFFLQKLEFWRCQFYSLKGKKWILGIAFPLMVTAVLLLHAENQIQKIQCFFHHHGLGLFASCVDLSPTWVSRDGKVDGPICMIHHQHALKHVHIYFTLHKTSHKCFKNILFLFKQTLRGRCYYILHFINKETEVL